LPDPITLSSDAELRARVDRALAIHYEIDREIGRGGMGIVYRARDRRLKRVVAVKLLPPELAFRAEIRHRFLREAETAAQLTHPNIVPIYSVDERDGLVYFVMACVDGLTLARAIHENGPLDPQECRRILIGIADALAYAHARGVVHRDIKPDNILLDAESGRPMVTDFGIARAVMESDSRLTATGVAIGTPAYMSPEQAAGDREIDGRSDLYSVGVLAYQMLAGELPFRATNTPTMLMKHLTERPKPINQLRSDLPQDLTRIVMTLLEKDPDARFPDATALGLALQRDPAAVFPAQPEAPPAPLPERQQPSRDVPARVPGTDEVALEHRDPTVDEVARWSAPMVEDFRRKFAYFAAVNSVIIVTSILADSGIYFITVFWGMYLATRYASLWSAGYDWRDVFRQTRDRTLTDVANEVVDEVKTVFGDDEEKKRELKQKRRRSRRRELRGSSAQAALPASSASAEFGAHMETVRQAAHHRSEVHRLVHALPPSERSLVADIPPAADALLRRVEGLALSLVSMERGGEGSAAADLDAQIARLESEANPLDRAGSEDRVRRLATLKRQRRAVAHAADRRAEVAARLESCALALQSMRLDVVRLRAGTVSSHTEHITLLTERARDLADDVDAVLAAGQGDIGGAPSGHRRGSV
jgi:eukaryotic-like serine/threonine-protein kinase